MIRPMTSSKFERLSPFSSHPLVHQREEIAEIWRTKDNGGYFMTRYDRIRREISALERDIAELNSLARDEKSRTLLFQLQQKGEAIKRNLPVQLP